MRPDMSATLRTLPSAGVLVAPPQGTVTAHTGPVLDRLLDTLWSRQALDTIDYAGTSGEPLLVAYCNEPGRPTSGLVLRPVPGSHDDMPIAARLAAILVRLLEQHPASVGASLEVAQALRLASLALPPAPPQPKPQPARQLAEWQRVQAVAYMDHHLADGFVTADVAARCGMSSSRFSAAFRVSFGISVRQWVIHRRVQLAQRMLSNEDVTLEAVAAACGFSEQCHFNRQFARVVGVPPGTWRRRHSTMAA
ncbi:helix-turn-helix domain-containing protein [Luteibacter pinisoli]|nr:AraC family transcriptional regulator [Luteibacter pinisoli]